MDELDVICLLQINVVTEPRCYCSWTEDPKVRAVGFVNNKTGIVAAKKALNILHQELGAARFTQVESLSIIK